MPRGRDWSRRDVGWLFTASTSSRLAQSATGVATALHLLDVLDSAADAGLVLAARAVPSLVAGPFTGAWLDRTNARRLPFAGSSLLLLVSLAALAAAAGRAPLGHRRRLRAGVRPDRPGADSGLHRSAAAAGA
jgi:MFS family permease